MRFRSEKDPLQYKTGLCLVTVAICSAESKNSNIVTLVERPSRYVMLAKVRGSNENTNRLLRSTSLTEPI
jgi:IS30 family transposase